MKRQVRFSSKAAIMNEKFNYKPMTPEVNPGQNAAENEKSSAEDDAVEIMWEKLVLYYLSRLKGLCDWRTYSWTAQKRRSDTSITENQIIKQVTKTTMKNSGGPKFKRNLTDIATFMAAGYEEGKQQAAKIVIRSLKFGVLTGILTKNGSVYRIRAKYLNKWKPQSFKKSKNKKKYRKFAQTCKKQNYTSMKLRSGKKCYKCPKKKNIFGKQCCLKSDRKRSTELKSDKKNLRPISPLLSSRSSSPKSNTSVRAGPARRKSSRVILKKPMFPKPSGKRRGRSQTKSPTPSKSRSRSPITRFKPRKLRNTLMREFHTPNPRRCSSVLSSISRSSTSAMSICTVCKKRIREDSNDSRTSNNVKKFRQSDKHKE